MGSRNPQKEMLKNIGAFETCTEVIDHALTSAKTKVKKLEGLKEELKTFFYRFDEAYRLYKVDVIGKDCANITEFNEKKEDGTDKFPFNEGWAKSHMNKFLELTETIEEKIEELEGLETKLEEAKPEAVQENMDHVATEVKSEKNSLEQSLSSFTVEVGDCGEISFTTATAMEKLSEKLRERLAMLRLKSRKVDDTLREEVNDFCNVESAKLDSILLQICKKVMEPPVSEFSRAELKSYSSKSSDEKVHLEKSKPPKFKGDIIEYPEFRRKWENIVGKANLPEEAEIERLKENIPAEAKDLLYGVTVKAKAWEILEKRFGDPHLIAKKLKTQLKSIQQEGKSDPERVIALTIKVRTIVVKLESLRMGEALQFDSEFLSAVYCALPSKHQVRWLDYEKSSNHWDDMMKFLERAYNQANDELALIGTYEADSKKLGLKQTAGKSFGAHAQTEEKLDNEESSKEKARKRSQEYCGKCPICAKEHTWTRKSGDKWPSDRFLSCRKFTDMTVVARAGQVQKTKGCPRCLSWNHTRDTCKMPANSCNNDLAGGVKCKGDHSKLLCGSGNPYCAAANVQGDDEFGKVENSAETVYFLQDIPVVNCEGTARTFWDDGSNRVFIRRGYAEKMKLRKKKVNFSLEAVDHDPESRSGYIYLLDLLDMNGKPHRVWGYSIDKIMVSSVPDLSALQSKFPHVPAAALESLEAKEVDILIGLNMAEIMPSGGLGCDRVGGMKALRSIFGTGWVMGGQPDSSSTGYVAPVLSVQASTARCAKVFVTPEPGLVPDFWECDQLGVKLPARCDRCRHCLQTGVCSEAHAGHTLKEQAELALIKANTRLVNGQIWCDYPFIKDPACLPNNRGAAVAVAEKVRRGLIKDGLLDAYNAQVQQILDRKAAVKLSKQEMEEYQGPTQYISHHAVLKDSISTPVRMVTNSSFSNGGSSLNNCLAAGPNSLNSMLGVTLRFRSREFALQYDLSKAYNSMKTTLKERHLRRFVWKFSDDEDWEDYGFDCVHFGDRCAACQLEVSKDLIADKFENIDPEAAQRIKDDCYVDDGVTGGTKEQVERFIGEKYSDGTFSGTIPQILGRGGFKLKAIVRSGERDQEQIDKMGTSVFGYVWDAPLDQMGVKFPVNLSRKKRSVRSQPDLTVQDIEKLGSLKFSKRILLGFVNGFGDPLGMASPWYMKLKVQMKRLYELQDALSWDDPIPAGNRQEWIDVMVEALLTGVVQFPRSTRPARAGGKGPMLVGFGDGALPGFGGSIYSQWQVQCEHEEGCAGDGDYVAGLCISKGRVCPLRGYTVPRSELCGALITSRLLLTVAIALSKLDEKPIGAIMLLDSRCSISALEATSGNLLPFFQNRIAEIVENLAAVSKYCEVEPVHWVSSEDNPADLLTRGDAHLKHIGPGSFHQLGPKFLTLPRDRWPVSRQFVRTKLPEAEIRHRDLNFFSAAVRSNFCFADPKLEVTNPFNTVERVANYSNSLTKVQRILVRVLRCWKKRPANGLKITNPVALTIAACEPTKAELDHARDMLLVHAMVDTIEAYNEKKLTSLLPVRSGQLIVTTGRLGERSLSRLLGVSNLPILMPNNRISFLYMMMAHEYDGQNKLSVENHRAAVATLARSRNYVWIVRGKQLAKKVVASCYACRRERKKLEKQQIGMLREEHLTVCPPWSAVSLDFAGPVKISGEVQKRITMKGWILVYVDQASRAVCLLLTPGYSTADFLLMHDRFTTMKGIPSKIVSDRGSQIVAGSIAIAEKDLPSQAYDWERVTRENKCSTWEFVPVGCQYRNLTEAMVKIVKKTLVHVLPVGRQLTYSEFETLLGRVEFSINSRPLALAAVSNTSQQEDMMQPLTPNQLLLGRNTAEVPPMEYDVSNRFCARVAYVQNVHTEWWARWIEEVMPTLIPCKKWKSKQRNMMKGDVVMLNYKGNLVDDYKLAKVTDVYPDEQGVVRTVQVSYRKRYKREPVEVYRSKPLVSEKVGVQRLTLLQPVDENPPTGE